MSNVVIDNVGGIRGVASEATLQSLIEAVKQINGGGAAGNAAGNRTRDLHNRSVRNNSAAIDNNTGAVKDNIIKLKEFGNQLVFGDERIRDFSDAIFGSTNIVSRFAGYVDGVIDDFRTLSSVGASFNNSLFDMVTSSANAAMTFDGFTDMIRSNSTELARFAGTVTNGAKFLGEFSRDIRLGIGNDFFAMGMTIQDINEGLVGFMTIESMRTRRSLRNDAATQESATNYIRQLNLLSKLTGKQASALEQDIMAMQTDTKTRNIFAEIERTRGVAARQEAEAIYALQKNVLPGFEDALLDLSDGVAQSDIGRALENMAPGITAFQQRLAQGGMSLEEYQSGMSQFGSRINEYARSIDGATLDVYRQSGGFVGELARLSDSAYQFNQLMLLDPAAARREQNRRDRLTATLGKFEQAVIAVRRAFLDAFLNSAFVTKLGEFGQELIDMFDTSSGNSPFSQAGSVFNRFFNGIFGDNGIATIGLTWLANYVKSGGLGRALNWLAEKATNIGKWFKEVYEGEKFASAINFISTQMTNFGNWFLEFTQEANRIGLWETIKNSFIETANSLITTFSGLWNDPQTQNRIETFFDNFTEAMADMWQGSRAREMMNKLTIFLQDSLTTLMETLNTGLLGLFIDDTALEIRRRESQDRRFLSGEMGRQEGKDYRAELERQLDRFETATGRARRGIPPNAIARVKDLLANAPAYAQGTAGFQNFGRQSLAMLHGNEAVIPRNTPAGDMLAEFYKSQKAPTVSATTPITTNNQSDLNNKLDQLNNTMQTVAALLAESVGVQHKMRKGIGNMSTDLTRG